MKEYVNENEATCTPLALTLFFVVVVVQGINAPPPPKKNNFNLMKKNMFLHILFSSLSLDLLKKVDYSPRCHKDLGKFTLTLLKVSLSLSGNRVRVL